MSVLPISPDGTSSVPGWADGALGRWDTLRGALPRASSLLPLSRVGAGVQEGRYLLHKPKKASPGLFSVQPKVREGSSTSCSPSRQRVAWTQPQGEMHCWQSRWAQTFQIKGSLVSRFHGSFSQGREIELNSFISRRWSPSSRWHQFVCFYTLSPKKFAHAPYWAKARRRQLSLSVHLLLGNLLHCQGRRPGDY